MQSLKNIFALVGVSLTLGLAIASYITPELVQAATPSSYLEAVTVAQVPPTLAWGSRITNPKVVILCIHGLGMHKGCYNEFGKLMASKGIPVYALDVRGFGDWYLKGDDKLDLPQTMADIKATIVSIKNRYPNSAVFLLGESMGGAIALRATAMFPDLVNALISSVPSGDRWSGLGSDLKVGLHVLAGGFGGRFNVGKHVVEHATQDEQLRDRWNNDPASRNKFSPDELLYFQGFMNENNKTAEKVKTTPVLILQGAQDKLVRPGGSFNVWDHLATPDRTFAASKSTEHLIFEYGRYSPDDINYVLNWIRKGLGPLPDQSVSDAPPEQPEKPKVPSKDELVASSPHLGSPNGGTGSSGSNSTNKVASVPADVLTKVTGRADLPSLTYWIELMREGKRYRCNNKAIFRSGDEIRIHLNCSANGFAYILMKQGTSGAHAVLFPEARTGRNNSVSASQDYALPSATWLKFDEKPGTERVCLVFSKTALDPDTNKYLNNKGTVVVSADKSGAKDLCPTRMQISWDDPNPLIMPALGGGTAGDIALASNSSMVKISQKEEQGAVIAVDIDLEHAP